MLRLQLPLYKAREQKLNGKTFGRKQPQWQIAHPRTNGLHLPPSLNDPHVLGDGTIYVIIQASSQRTGTLRYAVVLALPHLTLLQLKVTLRYMRKRTMFFWWGSLKMRQ